MTVKHSEVNGACLWSKSLLECKQLINCVCEHSVSVIFTREKKNVYFMALTKMKQPLDKMAWQFTSAVLTLHRTRSQPATPPANGPTRPRVQEQRGSAGSWAITQNRHVATMQISSRQIPPTPHPPTPQEQRWAKEANSQSKVLQGRKQPAGKRHLLVLNSWLASVSVAF